MTSTQFHQLAHQIIQNDPQKAGPLVQLLYGLRQFVKDPDGELLMDDLIGSLYSKTDHYQQSIKAFVSLAA